MLVGDPHQLPEIDAGGVLTGLAKRLDPIELIENRRQRARWEREALAELRQGDVDSAFAAYRDNHRVVTAPTAIDVRRAMVADWWAHRIAGDTVAMTAYRRDDVDDLNGRARAYLVRAGELSGPELVLDDRPYQAGDHIVCLRNNRHLGVHNGTRATIRTVNTEHGTMTITLDDRRVLLPRHYLDDRHIAHGYATTIHKTQGATVDRGLVLGTDELFRERGYVALSRGRISNHLYLVGATVDDDSTGHGPPPRPTDPTDAVQAALHHQDDKRLAIDTGEPLTAASIEELVTEHHRLTALLAASPPDRGHDVAALKARRERALTEIKPLIARHDELMHRQLRGPSSRTELRELRGHMEDSSKALDRLGAELDDARLSTEAHHQFQIEHVADAALLDAVTHEIENYLELTVEDLAQNPSDYYLHILGPVPDSSDDRVTWKRGATILERHHLGLDRPQMSALAKSLEHVELIARLETLAIPRQVEDTSRVLEEVRAIEGGM